MPAIGSTVGDNAVDISSCYTMLAWPTSCYDHSLAVFLANNANKDFLKSSGQYTIIQWSVCRQTGRCVETLRSTKSLCMKASTLSVLLVHKINENKHPKLECTNFCAFQLHTCTFPPVLSLPRYAITWAAATVFAYVQLLPRGVYSRTPLILFYVTTP